VLKQLSDRSLKRARRCDLRMLVMRDRKKRPVLESALADGTMATRLPERKTRHIPFPGQLFIIYTNHAYENRPPSLCSWLMPCRIRVIRVDFGMSAARLLTLR
jgi:hypothetical protein